MILKPSLSSKYYILFELPGIAYEIFNIFYNVEAFCIIAVGPWTFPALVHLLNGTVLNHLQFLLSQVSVFNDDGDNGWFPHLEFVIFNTLRKETKRSHKSKKKKKKKIRKVRWPLRDCVKKVTHWNKNGWR